MPETESQGQTQANSQSESKGQPSQGSETPLSPSERAELGQLKAKFAQEEATRKKLEADAARASGEISKLEGLWSEQLKAKESELAARDKRIAELEANEAKLVKQDRSSNLVQELSRATGIQNTKRLEGLLRLAEADGLDIAPEKVTPDVLKKTAEKLKAIDPETFSPRTGAPPVPGSGGGDLLPGIKDADYWRKRGELASGRRNS